MYALGWLTATERLAFEAQLAESHRVRSRVVVTDLDHRLIADLSDRRVSGSVQISADSDAATRSLSLEVFDPADSFGFGSGSAPVAPNRMLSVSRGVFVDALGEWVDVPVFCGPVTKPSRAGDTLRLECQDKAQIAATRHVLFSAKAGMNAGDAIKALLGATGETRFRVASTSRRLGRDRPVTQEVSPWAAVKSICSAIGWVCFYDGAGYLVAQPRSTAPVFTFRAGPGGSILSDVDRGFWDSEVKNEVLVTGATVGATVITAKATVAAANAFSPERLARNGRPGVVREWISDGDISSFDEADQLARRRVAELAVQSSQASFDALVVPHLQEWDTVNVVDPSSGEVSRVSVREATVPLEADGSMSVGYQVSSPRTKLRTRATTNRPKKRRR